MKIHYMWDAGILIGYAIKISEGNTKLTSIIEPFSTNCEHFIEKISPNHTNIIPSNADIEVKHRLRKNKTIYHKIIEFLKTGTARGITPYEKERFEKIIRSSRKIATDEEIITSLIEIQSTIQIRVTTAIKISKLHKYSTRIERKLEKFVEMVLTKPGDMANFSTAIHYNNHINECTFLTTDKADFGRVDLGKLQINLKIPKIEFIEKK